MSAGAYRVSQLGEINWLQKKLAVEISHVSTDHRIIVTGDDYDASVGRSATKEQCELQAVVFADPHVGDDRIGLFAAKVLPRVFVGSAHCDGIAVFAECCLQDPSDIRVIL